MAIWRPGSAAVLKSVKRLRISRPDEAISAVASAGAADEAIAAARKLRSPTERRKQLAKLFAQAGRWKELREVCQQVTSPEEAADIAWWTKFELPGGAVE